MKTLCPYCCLKEKPGCDKCTDGFLEVSFKKGILYAVSCGDCNMAIGGGFLDSKDEIEKFPHKKEKCPWCDSQNLLYELYDDEQ